METKQVESSTKGVPAGYHTVTPFVIVKGAAKFLDFLKDAFGATELGRVPDSDGKLGHAECKIGDSVIMTFDSKDNWPPTPAFLRLYVKDCEATYRQAIEAGAISVTKPTEMPWGDRGSRVADPFGNLWWIMTREEDLTPEEIEKRYGEEKYIKAMEYVQNAEFFNT